MSELASVAVEERGEVVVARVAGELDISNAELTGGDLERAVPRASRGLVLDFSELAFLDSSGVSMLFSLARRLGSHRQELRVVAPTGQAVGRVLEIVELGRAAPVHDSVDDALQDLFA